MDPLSDPGQVPVPAPHDHETTDDMRAVIARLDRLEQRIARLETAPARPTITPIHTTHAAATTPWLPTATARPSTPAPVADAGPTAAVPPPAEAAPPWPAWQPPPKPSPAHDASPRSTGWSQPSERGFDLRSLAEVGAGRLLAWVGGAALVLGTVFFLSLAFSRGWITNEMRVGLGLLGGIVLLILGPVTFDRRQPALAHVLTASGIAILELAIYAARLYGLVSAEIAMACTMMVAALATVIAIRFDSQMVAALGLIAVLAAPPLMDAPPNLMTVAFLFAVMSAASIVAIAHGWRWLPWLSLLITLPQLLSWVAPRSEPALLVEVACLGYWIVIAAAAAGEMWLRPLALRRDPSSWLLVTLSISCFLAAILGIGGWERGLGIWMLVLAAAHVATGSWFLVERDHADVHGQLFVAIAVPLAALGIIWAAPPELVALGWAAMAAGLCWLAVQWRHRHAAVEGLAMAALAGTWVATAIYPVTELIRLPFPPTGAGEYPTLAGLAIVAVLLAIITMTGRWALTSRAGRSGLASVAALLVAYMLPFETGSLVLLTLWVVLSIGGAMVAIRWFTGVLRRGRMSVDPLLLTGIAVGIVALLWSSKGFPMPHGSVDVMAPIALDRALASLLPIAGVLVMVAWLRPRWWRGATSAVALLLATAAVGLQAGTVRFTMGGAGTMVDGSFVVLVGWAALAVLALVLDERPSLRLSMQRDLVVDPTGHPLALTAIVPAIAELCLLAARFLAGGIRAPLPSTPFVDERTVATVIVMGFLVLAAAAAHTRLVRAVLLGVAAVLLGVLLPMEMPLVLAVTGWCLLAVTAVLVARGRGDIEVGGAWLLSGGLVICAIGATLVILAPPDRLFLEITRIVPTSGPPNEATLALGAIAAALAVGAILARPRPGSTWMWLGVGAALTWLLSIGIADVFAMRVVDGADMTETATQAQVALSITWAVLGLATLLAGLVRDIAIARQAGLALLAISTVKVFAYDLANLDIAYRVLSLIGLGVLLLVSAYAWAHARHHGGPQAMGR